MNENEIDALNLQVHKMEMNQWINHELFSLNWWIIVGFNIFFLITLVILADRRRTLNIVVAFLFAFIIVGTFDEIGGYFQWWSYPYELIPFSGRFNAVDFFAIPSIIAIIYQWFSRWGSFMVATLIYSVLNSYIGEPLFVFLGIYKLKTWTYTGSFLIMLVIPLIVKFLTDLLSQHYAQENNDREWNLHWLRRKEKIR